MWILPLAATAATTFSWDAVLLSAGVGAVAAAALNGVVAFINASKQATTQKEIAELNRQHEERVLQLNQQHELKLQDP